MMPWKAGRRSFSSSTSRSARNLGWAERPAKAELRRQGRGGRPASSL
jgi:hypothetical protein